MTRDEALSLLTAHQARRLSPAARQRLLRRIQREDWSGDPGWSALSLRVKQVLRSPTCVPARAEGATYDRALQMVLRFELRHASAAYLQRALAEAGLSAEAVVGESSASACPCCGRRTLDARGGFDICPVCWWEDDGLDSAQADVVSGPNRVTLLQGRINTLRAGICEPERSDLLSARHDPERYAVGRVFVLEGGRIREQGAGWSAAVPATG